MPRLPASRRSLCPFQLERAVRSLIERFGYPLATPSKSSQEALRPIVSAQNEQPHEALASWGCL